MGRINGPSGIEELLTTEIFEDPTTLFDQAIFGDQLWNWSTTPDSWEALCGRAGIALVRDGEVVDSILTVMN